MPMFGQIPKQTVHELRGEKELDYFFLMPFVWRKRCWLTAELQDPTQPGFSADAWLMRLTTGIIIRQGILVFSCVSQDGKTSSSAVPKRDFQLPSASYAGHLKPVTDIKERIYYKKLPWGNFQGTQQQQHVLLVALWRKKKSQSLVLNNDFGKSSLWGMIQLLWSGVLLVKEGV